MTDEPYIVNNLGACGGIFLSIIVASLAANYAFWVYKLLKMIRAVLGSSINANNIAFSSLMAIMDLPAPLSALPLRGRAENSPGRSIIAIMLSNPILFPQGCRRSSFESPLW